MSNLPIALFLLPFVSALILATIGAWKPRLAWPVSVVALALLCVVATVGASHVFSFGPVRLTLAGWTAPLGIELLVDSLSAFMSVLLATVSFFVILASKNDIEGNPGVFLACSFLMLSGLMGMVVAADLFNLFVHVEVASLSAYALVAAGGRGAPRAAFNYLIIGSFGASLYLLGVGFVYAGTGTLNMSDAAHIFSTGVVETRLMIVAATLIVIGLGIKMALFPLHGWMPAAYATASPMGASLMAPLVTKVSAYALFRVLFSVFGIEYLFNLPIILDGLLWAGAVAIVFGGVMAFAQRDLWRLFAYSSISQMGLVAVAFGLANQLSLVGGVLHIASDALMKGSLFLACTFLLNRYRIRNVDDLPSIRGQSPLLMVAIVISGLSLIGVPPLGGFFGKWYVLSGAVAQQAWFFAAIIIFGSLTSVAYVFKIFEKLFFSPSCDLTNAGGSLSVKSGGGLLITACLALAVCVAILGLFSEPLVRNILIPALAELSLTRGG